jgi:predicted CXXCH cytochrome family protein
MQNRLPLLTFSLIAIVGACTDSEIVYQERPPFNEPADASSGFLGYYTSSANQTTCGNCHADFQATWKETGHAQAYNAVKNTSGAQASCYGCHTVNARGNDATGTVGYDKVQDSTYYDVQCESCHGPGQAHVEGVNQGNITNRPLAHLAVGASDASGCGSCHTGEHSPFAEQWAESRHAMIRQAEVTNPSCVGCHEGRGAIKKWGVTSNYAERDVPTAYQPTTCAVCHNPHGSANKANLRFSVSDIDPSANLCMKCHLNRAAPVGGSSRGNQPHGAQGGVLLGFAGWRPPNFVYDTARIYGSHATSANPDLCAGCHVQPFTVTASNGGFVYQSVGHLFKPAPCLDAQGIPTGDDSCAFTPAARNWSSCTKSGCHANATAAASAFNATRSEIELLSDLLWDDTDGDKTIDAFPIDQGYLPRVKASAPADLNPSDQTVTAADGSEFNTRMCGENRADHPDGSKGTHNKFLCVALLSQSASYLKSIYAFLPSPPAEIQAIMAQWSKPAPAAGARIEHQPLPSEMR